jgi:Fe-S-cluster containining protein
MSPLKEREAVLRRIYDLYDQFAGTLEPACQKGCASCCTCNVTLTTLEARLITGHLENAGQHAIIAKLAQSPNLRRFQPRVTTNHLAALCMAGESLPEEACDPSWGRCPLLERKLCSIYPVRPFACRCLLSARKCEDQGHAEMSPFMLTVNTVFMQVIEHVDRAGMSGNLIDVMGWMAADGHGRTYGESLALEGAPAMIRNRPLPFFMVPPEHRERIAEMLAALRAICSP